MTAEQGKEQEMRTNDFNQNTLISVDQMMQEMMESVMPGDLMVLADSAANMMLDQTRQMMGNLVGYKELMMQYACAIKEIRTKFDVLSTECRIRYQRNPISSINTRLKRTASLTEKLSRRNLPFTLESIEENIHDVAGVRVICPYIDDIYTIANALLEQDDITLAARKDYIANPKPNGYRSLHLIVKVPVFLTKQKKEMYVEVQIRTIAMDFWASLEHQLKYKQEIPNQQEIIVKLKECAAAINATDAQMLELRKQIEAAADQPTEDDILFDKLSRLDISLD